MAIWYIFIRFGILYQEKSGNPGDELLRFCLHRYIWCLLTCAVWMPRPLFPPKI
jgi:hypothetical protein